jgi:hypothetical protein
MPHFVEGAQLAREVLEFATRVLALSLRPVRHVPRQESQAKKGVSLGQRVKDFEDIELKARPRETRRFACDPRR